SMIKCTSPSYCRSESQKIHLRNAEAWNSWPLHPSFRASSISNSDEPASALKAPSIPMRSVRSWSNWAGDLAAREHEHLDRRRHHGHAARLHRLERRGADSARTESVFGPCVCLPRPARRSGKGALVGWRRPVSVRQAFGTRPLRVAAGRSGSGFAEPGATLDAARRHRLAQADTDGCAINGGVEHFS